MSENEITTLATVRDIHTSSVLQHKCVFHSASELNVP